MNFTRGLNRAQKTVFFVVLLFLMLSLPLLFPNPAYIGMFITCGVASVLAMGWLLILRIGGLSLGQVAFLAIGAYTSAVLVRDLAISPWLGLFLGGLSAGLVALGIGLVFLKISGLSFAIITFAFAEVVRLVVATVEFFGGHGGILNIPKLPPLRLPVLGQITFDSHLPNYYVMLLIVLISGIFMWRMDHSALGRTFKSLSQNEDLAQSLGINPLRYKLICFITACFFAGVAGAFTAHYYNVLYPGSYTVMHSVFVQIQGTVGGAASVAVGGLLGGSVMVIIETFLLNVDPRLIFIFYGLVIIAITFFLPNGLLSLPDEMARLRMRLKTAR
jgi:branched-chain amino acid transport system permease protein